MIDPFGTPRFFFMSGRVCHIPVALDPPEINDDGGDDGDDKDDDNDEDEDDDEDDDLHVFLIYCFVRVENAIAAARTTFLFRHSHAFLRVYVPKRGSPFGNLSVGGPTSGSSCTYGRASCLCAERCTCSS